MLETLPITQTTTGTQICNSPARKAGEKSPKGNGSTEQGRSQVKIYLNFSQKILMQIVQSRG